MSDRAFQLTFVSRGAVIVYDDNWKEMAHIGPDSQLVSPILGEVAFFMGCTQPFHAKVPALYKLCVRERELSFGGDINASA